MKYYIFLFNFCLSFFVYTQVKIRVFDGQYEFIAIGANIFNETKELLGETDEIGELEINTSSSIIKIVKKWVFLRNS